MGIVSTSGSACLVCLNSLGKVLALSLPKLTLLLDVECNFLMTDYRCVHCFELASFVQCLCAGVHTCVFLCAVLYPANRLFSIKHTHKWKKQMAEMKKGDPVECSTITDNTNAPFVPMAG